jgi:hypothetical protein
VESTVSFDTFVLKVSEPLQPEDICYVMDHFHGPLHQKWLNFLSPVLGMRPYFQDNELLYPDLAAPITILTPIDSFNSIDDAEIRGDPECAL